MKKLLAILLALSMLFVLVVACGNGDEDVVDPPAQGGEAPPPAEDDEAPPPAEGDEAPPSAEGELNNGEEATIRFSWWGGDSRHEAVLAAIEIFESRYPWITVEPEFGAFDGYLDALTVQLAGQAEPDVVQVNYAWIHNLGGGINVFADLHDFADIIDFDEFDPTFLDTTTTADGQRAGLPLGMHGRVILYNVDMLAEHGFETFPETWDELIELGAQVSAGNTAVDGGGNQYPFFPAGSVGNNLTIDILIFQILYNETGKSLVENGQIAYTVDEVASVFEMFQRAVDAGAMPSAVQLEGPGDVTHPVWMEGRGGSVFEWVGNINVPADSFMDTPGEEGLAVALAPAMSPGGGRSSLQRPSLVHTISRNSDHPEVAAYFLNFLYTDEEALTALQIQFGVPAGRTALMVAEREGLIYGLRARGTELLETHGLDMGSIFEDPGLRGARLHAIESWWLGVSTPAEAAALWIDGQNDEMP